MHALSYFCAFPYYLPSPVSRQTLVEVDTASGKTTPVARLPFVHDPVMHTSTMRGNATYMVQLKGPLQFQWVQVDVDARRIVSRHTTKFSPSDLAMSVYV